MYDQELSRLKDDLKKNSNAQLAALAKAGWQEYDVLLEEESSLRGKIQVRENEVKKKEKEENIAEEKKEKEMLDVRLRKSNEGLGEINPETFEVSIYQDGGGSKSFSGEEILEGLRFVFQAKKEFQIEDAYNTLKVSYYGNEFVAILKSQDQSGDESFTLNTTSLESMKSFVENAVITEQSVSRSPSLGVGQPTRGEDYYIYSGKRAVQNLFYNLGKIFFSKA